jgi:hypothetical protein
MIVAKQHIPGFAFDPRDEAPPVVSVATVAELLEVRWIKSWRDHPKFWRYALSRDYAPAAHLLMAELEAGREWWVLAYVNKDPALDELPTWSQKAAP